MHNNIYIDPSSIVSENAKIGKNTKIWQFSVIMEDVEIGTDCNIGMNVFIEKGVKIGNNVTIKNNVSLYTGAIIEDDVFLGPSCVFTNVINPRSFVSRKHEFKSTTVKKGSSIGANATIVCGVTLNEYCFVGAGSVVTKDVEPFVCVVGNPARFKSYICQCGELRSNTDQSCSVCGFDLSKVGLENGKLKETEDI